MNCLLCATVLIAVFSAFISANPVFKEEDVTQDHSGKSNFIEKEEPLKHSRSRRSAQFGLKDPHIFINGNYDRKAGTNIDVKGQTQVWQSPNKRNEIGVQGNYGQRFGGPGGNSPPNFGGGVKYTFHF